MTSLSFDPESIDIPVAHYIHGEFVAGKGEMLQVRRPSDGQHLGSLPEGGAQGVDAAVASAGKALTASGWDTCPPRERGRVLRRWADLIVKHGKALARLEAVSSTRPIRACMQHEVPFTAEAIRFFAECADKYSTDFFPTRERSVAMEMAEPYGIIGAIAPWNFPLSMASWKCGPALAAGNAIVLKPSEFTPYSTLMLADLAVQAGIPRGIFNVLSGTGPETGAAMVRHPDVRKISFTGSTSTGAAIMSDAALHGIKPVTLELGGKSPQLVFDDAGDLDEVADRIVRGFTANAGQACVSGSRLIVHESLAEALTEKIMKEVGNFRPGLTWDDATTYSPLIHEQQANKVDRLVEDSIAAGAEVITGRGFFETAGGHFYRPTLLTRVDHNTPAVREEVFGPVLTVQTFRDDDEGIALSAHPVYGLAAGVHTASLDRALRCARELAAGTVWINRFGRSGDFIIPTGGFNGSGIGKDLGRQAFEASLRTKSVLIDYSSPDKVKKEAS